MGAVGLAVITLKECLARPPNDFSIRWWSFNNPRIQKKFPAVKFLLDTEKYCKNGLFSFFLDVGYFQIQADTPSPEIVNSKGRINHNFFFTINLGIQDT